MIRKVVWVALFEGIGDAVLFAPTLKRSAEIFAGARCDIVVKNTAVKDVLELYGFRGRIIVAETLRFAGVLKLAVALGINSYDIAFDASSVQQTHLSRWLCAILSFRRRVGYHYGSSSWLYTDKLHTGLLLSGTQKEIYAALLGTWGNSVELELEPPTSLVNSRAPARTETARIVLHPGARDNVEAFEKRWPIDRYKELARRLLENSRVEIEIIGSGSEKAWIDSSFAGLTGTRVKNLAGATSVRELFEIIRDARLFVGNNSGPFHIASAFGIPLLSFAGGVAFPRWAACGKGKALILGMKRVCSPCNNYECADHGRKCLDAVSVDEALGAALSLLA